MVSERVKVEGKHLFFYLYLIIRIKENSKSQIVDKKYLKKEIAHLIVRRGGFPKRMIKYLIDDLVKLNLISKKNKVNLYILNDDCCKEERKIRNLINYM